MQVQDHPLGRVGELRCDRPDPLEQDILRLLAVRVPGRRVRPARSRPSGSRPSRPRDPRPARPAWPRPGSSSTSNWSSLPGAHEHALGLAGQLLLGHLHPPLDGAQHVAVEQVVEPVGVGLELGQLFGRRAERVVPAPDHVLLERGDLVLAREVAALLLQRPVPALAAVVDHRDERLAGHVAAEDHDVGLVVRAGVQELAPARLRPVDVRGEEDSHVSGFWSSGRTEVKTGKTPIPWRRASTREPGLSPRGQSQSPGLRAPRIVAGMPRDPRFDILFEPVQIGPKTLRNRFYQVPHCTGFGVEKPWSQAAHRAVKAEGGWAAVCTEYCTVSADADETPYISARMWDDHDLRHLGLLCDAVHAHGSLAGIELSHSGAHGENCETRLPPPAPSQIPSDFSNITPKAMEQLDIDRIITRLGAWRPCARATPASTSSTSTAATPTCSGRCSRRSTTSAPTRYGGSLENRARMWIETLAAVREAVGSDCAIACRMAVSAAGGAGRRARRGPRVRAHGRPPGRPVGRAHRLDLGVVEGLGRVALLRRGLAARVDRARARGDARSRSSASAG